MTEPGIFWDDRGKQFCAWIYVNGRGVFGLGPTKEMALKECKDAIKREKAENAGGK